MASRCWGGTDFTPSTPAVFLPWLSCVTRRTASRRAALDFISSFCSLWTALRVATLFGSKDALLYPVHMLLELAPGQLAPTLTLRIGRLPAPGCLRICHPTCASFFHITVPTLAYPGLTPGIRFFGNPSSSACGWSPAHCIDPNESGLEVIPFRYPFCAPLGLCYPPGIFLGETMSSQQSSSLLLVFHIASLIPFPFGQVFHPV